MVLNKLVEKGPNCNTNPAETTAESDFSASDSVEANSKFAKGSCFGLVYIPNRTFLVRFGGISGEFGRAMVRILATYPNSAQNLALR